MRVSDISALENVRERHSATIVILSILIASRKLIIIFS